MQDFASLVTDDALRHYSEDAPPVLEQPTGAAFAERLRRFSEAQPRGSPFFPLLRQLGTLAGSGATVGEAWHYLHKALARGRGRFADSRQGITVGQVLGPFLAALQGVHGAEAVAAFMASRSVQEVFTKQPSSGRSR